MKRVKGKNIASLMESSASTSMSPIAHWGNKFNSFFFYFCDFEFCYWNLLALLLVLNFVMGQICLKSKHIRFSPRYDW